MPQILVLDSISAAREALGLKPIDFGALEDILCESVAEALNVPNIEHAQLSPDDVEVDIITSRSIRSGANKLRILVFANYFEERASDLQSVRVQKISAAVKTTLPEDVRGFVYVRLAPAGFAEF